MGAALTVGWVCAFCVVAGAALAVGLFYGAVTGVVVACFAGAACASLSVFAACSLAGAS